MAVQLRERLMMPSGYLNFRSSSQSLWHESIHLNPIAHPLFLNNILYFPNIKYNLLSIEKLCHNNNYFVIFDAS